MKKIITKQPPLPPWVVGTICLLVSGLGQIVIGQWKKGFLILFLSIVAAVISGGLLVIPIACFASYDAWKCASRLKAGGTLSEWQWVPDN